MIALKLGFEIFFVVCLEKPGFLVNDLCHPISNNCQLDARDFFFKMTDLDHRVHCSRYVKL